MQEEKAISQKRLYQGTCGREGPIEPTTMFIQEQALYFG